MIQDNLVQKLCNIKTGFETATEVYQLDESEEEVTVLVGVESPKKSRDATGRAAPGVRAAKSSESRKGK